MHQYLFNLPLYNFLLFILLKIISQLRCSDLRVLSPYRKRRLRNDEPMSEEIRSLRQKRPHKGILKNSSAYDDGFKAPYPISAFPPRLQ